MVVGARAVQVGTANLYDPAASGKILKQIKRFLEEEGIADVKELVGSLRA